MKLPKLVRDKIPQIIEEDGTRSCDRHTAAPAEYRHRLYEKLREELDEFINTPCYQEAADIYEVFSAICAAHDLNMVKVEVTAVEKRGDRGGVSEKIVLDRVDPL